LKIARKIRQERAATTATMSRPASPVARDDPKELVMTLVRLASLLGVGLLVLVLNVGMSIVYMVVYGHLINPGHPKEFYDEHIKVAAPYCSIVAGVPLMLLAGLWVGGWSDGAGAVLGVRAALAVWLAYTVIDVAVLLAAGAGAGARIAMLCAVSLITKLVAAYAGGLLAVHLASRSTLAGPG